MYRIASWMTVLTATCLGIFGGESLGASQALAQTVSPSCSLGGGGPNFACIGDLDGNGLQQIVVGYVSSGGTQQYVIIIANTGAVRRRICWTAGGTPVCPNVTVQ